MRYYVGSELGIANYIQRNFDVSTSPSTSIPWNLKGVDEQWSSNSLFFEDIPEALDPKKTMFFLGESDSILSAHVRPLPMYIAVTDSYLTLQNASPLARSPISSPSWGHGRQSCVHEGGTARRGSHR